jgi:repressor LexA
MKRELTERQEEVLRYIKWYVAKYGYAPSVRCIADRFDMQVNGAKGHLDALETKGWIKRTRGLARAMVVCE